VVLSGELFAKANWHGVEQLTELTSETGVGEPAW